MDLVIDTRAGLQSTYSEEEKLVCIVSLVSLSTLCVLLPLFTCVASHGLRHGMKQKQKSCEDRRVYHFNWWNELKIMISFWDGKSGSSKKKNCIYCIVLFFKLCLLQTVHLFWYCFLFRTTCCIFFVPCIGDVLGKVTIITLPS